MKDDRQHEAKQKERQGEEELRAERRKVAEARATAREARRDPRSYSCYEDYYAYWRSANSQSDPGAMMELRAAKKFFENKAVKA